MREFFRIYFASILATVTTFLLMGGLFVMFLFVVLAATDTTVVSVSENSVLHLTLNKPIVERAHNNPLDDFDFGTLEVESKTGLNKLLNLIKRARTDSNIKGIFLDFDGIMAGFATHKEIRDALKDFKSSGKFVVAYSRNYTQGGYYVASVADSVWLHPLGYVDNTGLSANIMFIKGLLDKLELEPQIVRVGKFKSAIEPLTSKEMSKENEQQIKTLISSIWNVIVSEISADRKISIERINNSADSLSSFNAQNSKRIGFVDNILYDSDVDEQIKLLLKGEKPNFVTLEEYSNTPLSSEEERMAGSSNAIAVVYADGEIVDGRSSEQQIIASYNYIEAIKNARENNKIKAIVVRVNSPGGSALASEEIWYELKKAKEKKPVIVSMGDYAASGGYYISAPADRIFANELTITGSIGIFGVFFNIQKLFNNKLGITFDGVNTHKYSDFMSGNRPMSDYELGIVTNVIGDMYQVFLSRVSEGRNMSIGSVDSIGQGRVWTGADARSINLVDSFGGLNDALKAAAKLAKINDYYIIELPHQKDWITELSESLQMRLKTNTPVDSFVQMYNNIIAQVYALASDYRQARLPFTFQQ